MRLISNIPETIPEIAQIWLVYHPVLLLSVTVPNGSALTSVCVSHLQLQSLEASSSSPSPSRLSSSNQMLGSDWSAGSSCKYPFDTTAFLWRGDVLPNCVCGCVLCVNVNIKYE